MNRKTTIGWSLIVIATFFYLLTPPQFPIRTAIVFFIFGISCAFCGGDAGDRTLGGALIALGIASLFIEIPYISGM